MLPFEHFLLLLLRSFFVFSLLVPLLDVRLALVDAFERRVKSRVVFRLPNGFLVGLCVVFHILDLFGSLLQLMGYVALRQVREGRTRS